MPDEDARDTELHARLLTLKRVVDDLTDARRELTEVLTAERRSKVETWAAAEPSLSEKAKERQSDYFSLDLSLDVLKLKGEIASLEDHRDLLLLIIDVLRSDLYGSAMGVV